MVNYVSTATVVVVVVALLGLDLIEIMFLILENDPPAILKARQALMTRTK